MSDVIDRLRAIYPEHHQVNQWCVRYEAATEIERLRAENEKLRAALKRWEDTGLQKDWPITYDDCAAAALKETGNE